MAAQMDYKCLVCGGTDLCFGYVGTPANVFVPTGTFTFHGFKTRSYVCLKCGNVGHFMSKDRLQKLRERFSTQFE